MNIETTFEANAKFAKPGDPSMRAFDDPTMPSEPLAAFHAATGDTSLDASLLQIAPAASEVVALVRMQLSRAFARLAAQARHCRDSVQRGLECHRVVSIGARDRDGQWDTASVYGDVPFRSELSSIRRVGAGFLAPRGLETLAPSRLARSQSIWSCSRNRRSISKCNRAHTPATCQSRRRRQHVIPLPKQAPAASLPMDYRFAAHIGCRSALRGHQSCDVDRLWVTA
ncbi:transposase Tn3 family protein [Burkholderia lata]|nr:transposase Tn3 family protein [Burkholderia lata]